MLSLDKVYVWRVSLDRSTTNSAPHIATWRAMLSAEEICRSERFISAGLCHDYIASHAALRIVLGQCLGISPASVQFAHGPVAGDEGELTRAATIKPTLLFAGEQGNQSANLHFSLSHTRGAALIGVARDRELGVDIEWQRPLDDLHAMARCVMSSLELERWLAMAPVERTQGFYNVWTRKEAYLKAIGLGLYRNLQEVTVPVSASPFDARSDEAFLVQDDHIGSNWTLRDIPVNEGYSASVCRESCGTFDLAIEDLDICRLSPVPAQANK